ncbi:protein LYK5-like [Salvia divinorum]|uniref:Protein LYK5-like n=1 Tax=Salvia divinorum TaxID=28513 RepID=A0ABD1HKK8_SALDI
MYMIISNNLIPFLVILASTSSRSDGQQQYSGNSVMNCEASDETGPSPAFLYSCNDQRHSCKALLMFRTQPPYVSVSSIANLTSSDPKEMARLNNITTSEILPPGSAVFVPAMCLCLGKYYQANTSYVYKCTNETYFTIANQTYQGLTSCNALKRHNPYSEVKLIPSINLRVPLRCACPSEEQISNGTKFLLTFLIAWHDSVANISKKFNVSAKSVAAANGFATEDPIIYPFTTILIPLKTEPQASNLRWLFSTSFPYAAVSHTKPSRWISVGVGSGAALAVFCFLALLGFLHFKRVSAARVSREMKDGLPEHFLDKVVGIGESLKIYKYDELEAATDNFSPQRRLSESIYHGILRGNRVAVKKTRTDVSKEIKILGNLNHFNLINLYGVCEHHEVFYLVYEYMEEGSLKNWLCGETSACVHSWNHRFLIALDVANGLDYLHNCTSPAYVHKDINSCNILLNRELRAKITNFSLARDNGKSHSGSVVGEKGYMAPEYVEAGEVSPKIDVYAFGVVLLELITGREAVLVQDGEESFLSEVVISIIDKTHMTDTVNGLVDPRLQVKHPLGFAIDQSELALRLLKLCAACLAPQPTRRLSMGEVVNALMKIHPDVYNPQSFSIE